MLVASVTWLMFTTKDARRCVQEERASPGLIGLLGDPAHETSRDFHPQRIEIVVNEVPEGMDDCGRGVHRPPPRGVRSPRCTESASPFFRSATRRCCSTPTATKS